MALLRWTCLTLFILVLTGCFNQPLSLESREQIRKVAVVSLMGDDLFLLNVGTTAFTNSERYLKIEGWDIDRFVEKTAVSALSAKGRYQIVRYDPEKAGIKSLYGSVENFDMQRTRTVDSILPRLRGMAADSKADDIIVIRRCGSSLPPAAPDYLIAHGDTFLRRSFLTLPIDCRLYLIYFTEVIDTKTMKVTAYWFGGPP